MKVNSYRNLEDLRFIPDFLNEAEHMYYYNRLVDEVVWTQRAIKFFGKEMLQPRLLAWQGTESYTYSGTTLSPLAFSPGVLELKERVSQFTEQQFNSVLINYYRKGNDSMGLHSDDEKELGSEPFIASLSLGHTRNMIFKSKNCGATERLLLTGGSLLIMSGKFQKNWKHAIPKTKKEIGGRINLTFRNILSYLKN